MLGAIAFCLSLSAQEPAYLHYDVVDGLPSSVVYCGLQDKQGFIWLGTDNGLVRFDGTRFKVFGMKDGLPDQEVVNIFEDSAGRIWLSCFGKQPAYFMEGKFVNASNDTLLQSIKLSGNYHFFEDSRKRVWITSNNEFYFCFDGNKLENFVSPYTVHKVGEFDGNIITTDFWSIEELTNRHEHSLCFQTPAPFLTISLEELKMAKRRLRAGTPAGLKFFVKNPTAAIVQAGNRILFAYNEGLLLVEYTGNEFKEVDRIVGGISGRVAHKDKLGRIWLTHSPEGAICFGDGSQGLRNPKFYLKGKKISSAFTDKEHNIWFTTLNEGVYVLPQDMAYNFRKDVNNTPFLSNNITASAKLTNGGIAFGGDGGNVYVFHNNKWKTFPIPSKNQYNRVRQIIALEQGEWVAFTDELIYDSGLTLFPNKAFGSFKKAYSKGDTIWAGTSGYLIKWVKDYKNVQIKRNARTTVVSGDSEGVTWCGGLDGLYSEKDGFKESWGEKFPPLKTRIVDIKVAGKNKLWVATPENGLLRISTDKGAVVGVELLNEKLKTPIGNIQSLYVDDNERLWIASNQGVYAVHEDWSVYHYNQSNGIANNMVNCILVDHDTLWAATAGGVTKMTIKQQLKGVDSQTKIIGLRYKDGDEDKYIDLYSRNSDENTIVIPSTANMLEVDIAALHYGVHGNLKFDYLVEESLLPIQWISWGNLSRYLKQKFTGKPQRTIVAGTTRNFGFDLTPGSYGTTVIAILQNGMVSSRPDHLNITILPYWYETIWFSFIVAFLFGFGIFRLFRARENYLKMQNVNSELQLQAIRAQMNPHFVGNSINAIQQFFYPPDPIKASEYISIFSDLLRRTLYFSERDFIPFDEELVYIQDYLKMIKLRFGTRFNYSINGAEGIESRVQFPAMLLQPILENATIHGLAPNGTSNLMVSFEQRQNKVFCSIQDNGVGIEVSKARKLKKGGAPRISKGIAMLEKKISTLNQLYPTELMLEIRDLAVEDAQQHGTRVVLSFIPIKVSNDLK